ncbi:uncharacterized protein V6R79_011227 [Siganus canaliculatus]
MKTSCACFLIYTWLFEACAELLFQQLRHSQSLELTCSPQQGSGSLTGLYLYHRGAQNQTTILSLTKDSNKLRLDPDLRGRLRVHGGLDSSQVNVTISHIGPSDTGLYMWELSYTEKEGSELNVLYAHKVFLLVERGGNSCQCSPSYPPLVFTISTAAGLLLLVTLSWQAAERCVNRRQHAKPQPSAPIYEEMSRKQQSAGTAQNNQEASSHLEEVHFPVYANPNIRQPQDNYYACPRQLRAAEPKEGPGQSANKGHVVV